MVTLFLESFFSAGADTKRYGCITKNSRSASATFSVKPTLPQRSSGVSERVA